jgi:toxin ParE1/3/4
VRARTFEVLLTANAEQDIECIHDFLCRSDGKIQAERVLERLLDVVESLSSFPERGAHPKELLTVGFRECRQVLFKPYRVIYQTSGRRVIIHLICDGRRDMQTLLARRLLG